MANIERSEKKRGEEGEQDAKDEAVEHSEDLPQAEEVPHRRRWREPIFELGIWEVVRQWPLEAPKCASGLVRTRGENPTVRSGSGQATTAWHRLHQPPRQRQAFIQHFTSNFLNVYIYICEYNKTAFHEQLKASRW